MYTIINCHNITSYIWLEFFFYVQFTSAVDAQYQLLINYNVYEFLF